METISKGKAGQIGEIRTWAGKKYQKTAKGWRPVAGNSNKAGAKEPESEKEAAKITADDFKKGNFELVDAELSKEISDYKTEYFCRRNYKESAELKVKDGKISFTSKVREYNDPNIGNFHKIDVNSRLNIEIPEKEFKQILALAKYKDVLNVSFSLDRVVDYKRVRSDVRCWKEGSNLVLDVYTFGTYGVSAGVKQKGMSGTSDCFSLLIKDYIKKLGIAVSE